MPNTNTNPRRFGFTVLDLIVIIAAIIVLGGLLLLPTFTKPRSDPYRMACFQNLKQVGLGLHIYAYDHDGKFRGVTNGLQTLEAWQYFQVAGNEIGNPRALLCPKDFRSSAAPSYPTDFNASPTSNSFAHPQFQNVALSYFYGVDATPEQPGTVIAGDRNMSTNEVMLSQTIVTAIRSNSLSWTKDIHDSKGNILLADGSAQQVSNGRFHAQIAVETNTTQRFVLP